MAEKAVAVRRQRELAAQVDQLKVGHSRVQQQLQSQSDSLEKRVHILESELKRSAQSESMMRQQVSLLKSQVSGQQHLEAASGIVRAVGARGGAAGGGRGAMWRPRRDAQISLRRHRLL